MGYSGGSTTNPTYRAIGDHTETLQVDFDPTQVSYDELLELFWESHDPTQKSLFRDRQYMSLLILHSEEQKTTASRSKEAWEQKLRKPIKTEFQSNSLFYLAEDYHQKYFLKRYNQVINSLQKLYPAHDLLLNATITARLNGFVRGRGGIRELKEEMRSWGWQNHEVERAYEVLDSLKW